MKWKQSIHDQIGTHIYDMCNNDQSMQYAMFYTAYKNWKMFPIKLKYKHEPLQIAKKQKMNTILDNRKDYFN